MTVLRGVLVVIVVVVDDYFDGIYAQVRMCDCDRLCMFFTLLPT